MRRRDVIIGLALATATARAGAQVFAPPFPVTTNDPHLGMNAKGEFVIAAACSPSSTEGGPILALRYDASTGGAPSPLYAVDADPTCAHPAVARTDAGGFLVVWSRHSDTVRDLFGQRYDAAGAPAGAVFRVNDATTGDQRFPEVAADASGNFVVVWEGGVDSFNGRQIFVRRFDASAAPLGMESRVDLDGAANARHPTVARMRSGAFVVSWFDSLTGTILARRYDASGAPAGGPFRVNGATASYAGRYPSVAASESGRFLVAWDRPGPQLVVARRYEPDGTPSGPEFLVQHPSPPPNLLAGAAADGPTSFVVAWFGTDPFGTNLHVRHVSSSGQPFDPEVAPVPAGGGLGTAQVASDGRGNAIALSGYAPPLLAYRTLTPLEPLGGEFRVNTDTAGVQESQSVAEATDGGFVVTWKHVNAGVQDILGQRYDPNAAPIGGPFRVNEYSTSYQSYPNISAVPGGYVVAWYGAGAGGVGMYGRRLDATGAGLGADFQIHTTTTNIGAPLLGTSATGSFVAVWSGYSGAASGLDVYARRYASSGAPVGSELRVNTSTTGDQYPAAVAMSPNGDYAVVWNGPSTDTYDILGQRYAADGAPLGGEFRVNETTTGFQGRPSVAKDSQGNFVVAWETYFLDGSLMAVAARRYAANGDALGSEFRVNSYTTNHQQNVAVAYDPSGGFTVAWRSLGQDGSSYGVYARRFKKTGEPFGDDFRVNTYTTNSQSRPAIALGRNVVVTWTSTLQDGSVTGVYGQAYRAPCRVSDVNGDGQVTVNDVFQLINYLFAGGAPPACGGDANGDTLANVADVFYLINYLFAGGPPPA